MNRSLVLFLGIVIVGAALVTFLYRAVAFLPPSPDAGTVTTLSDVQKLLLESQSSLSKWLLGLAYTTLAGLFGFRIKNPEDERFRESFPLVACALLVISLYGGFLFQQASLFALRRGPADLLFGDGIELTLQVQFWFLAFGLIVLAAWLFRSPGKKKGAAALVLLTLLSASPLLAAEGKPSPMRACVDAWQEDRNEPLGLELAGEVTQLIEELAMREKVALQGENLCSFASSVLDELRFSTVGAGNAKVAEKLPAVVSSTRQDLASPSYAQGSLVQKLIRLSQIWQAPSGLLLVLSQEGRFEIFLSGKMVGVTNWTRRLEPGKYTLRFTQKGRLRKEYDQQVTIEEGKLVQVELGGKKD